MKIEEELINQALRSQILAEPLTTKSLEREGSIFVVIDWDFNCGAFLGPQEFVREDIATGNKEHIFLYPVYRCMSCGARYSTHKWKADAIPIVTLDCGCTHCPSCLFHYGYCQNCQLSHCWRHIHKYENGVLRDLMLCETCSWKVMSRAEELGLTVRW